MKIEALREHWDQLAQEDAMWAILTKEGKQGGKWEGDEFFALGVREIDGVMDCVKKCIGRREFRSALDFGCGVGRLTQALAQHSAAATGVDISENMVAQAKKWNRHGERVSYLVNTDPDLRQLQTGSFDFVYSNIVLQHMAPAFAQNYIREFFRILEPGGIVVFQIPEQPRWTLIGTMLRVLPMGLIRMLRKMDMYGMKEADAVKLGQSQGAKLLEVRLDEEAGPHWVSKRYMFQKV